VDVVLWGHRAGAEQAVELLDRVEHVLSPAVGPLGQDVGLEVDVQVSRFLPGAELGERLIVVTCCDRSIERRPVDDHPSGPEQQVVVLLPLGVPGDAVPA
jgi:hypothetical protein